jgi:hypothetical protein
MQRWPRCTLKLPISWLVVVQYRERERCLYLLVYFQFRFRILPPPMGIALHPVVDQGVIHAIAPPVTVPL